MRISEIKVKNILITGGAGFIGSNLALELQNRHPKEFWIIVKGLEGCGSSAACASR